MTAEDEAERLREEFRGLLELPCRTGKHKHGTKADAINHATHNDAGLGSGRTTAFRCGYCGYWHVGRR